MQLALKAMLKAAQMASRNFVGGDLPPPYTPPTSGWYMAPPPAYSANPAGYQVHTCIHTLPTSAWYMALTPAFSANPAGYQVLLHLHTAHQWLVHDTASRLLCQPSRLSGTIIWGKTVRVKNFKVILKIFRKCFLEFFFS